MNRKTADAARGKWRGVLLQLGVDQNFLTGKHGPCPICGGTDRFRWDNQHGNGGYICSQCGAGSGFSLLMGINGWDFATAAHRVDEVVGNVNADPIPKAMNLYARNRMLNGLWTASRSIEAGDPAFTYLAGRVLLPKSMPKCLRFAPECPSPGGVKRPALLAVVQSADGEAANIHRTFLGPNGKAEMDNPRAMMPGAIPDGSAVRLFPVHGARLGVAEGIETAFAAAARFNVPVWSAINSNMMTKWLPPPGVREVLVFGDCDRKFGGQAAAFALAHKLTGRMGLTAEVLIPPEIGTDWADEPAVAMGGNGRDEAE